MLTIDIQQASTADASQLPSDEQFEIWVEAALQQRMSEAELSVRIVDEDESQALNLQYLSLIHI